MHKPLQLTLAILKPHILSNPIALQDIRNIILASQFKIVKSNRRKLLQQDAELFYLEHKEKFFFNRLVTFMTSGPIEFYILAREDAIQHWRKLMGPTKVFKTQFDEPNSIRGKYGLSDTRNATHGSDSEESARKEIGFFFPEFDVEKWYKDEERYFREENKLLLNETKFEHCIKN